MAKAPRTQKPTQASAKASPATVASEAHAEKPTIQYPPAGAPSRAALITGRNHHMGALNEIATGFPGYDSAILKSTATVKQAAQEGRVDAALRSQ